jgi:Uma2 family endonuclease
MSQPARKWISPEAYLAGERAAEYKSEYLDGEILAMSGASKAHCLITANVIGKLWAELRGRCLVYSSDLKIEAAGAFFYPDVSVACGEQVFRDGELDVLQTPGLVVEVLSPSTAAFDRGRKFQNYRQVPSLREVLLVAQDRPEIEHRYRDPAGPAGEWKTEVVHGLEAVLDLPALSCQLLLAEVYADVKFPESPPKLRIGEPTAGYSLDPLERT